MEKAFRPSAAVSFSGFPKSLRDNEGTIELLVDTVIRRPAPHHLAYFETLSNSGFFAGLNEAAQILPLERVAEADWQAPRLKIWTYAHEWTRYQIRDAALLTLTLCLNALEHDSILKDASPFNVQFVEGRPVFVDHFSFVPYVSGEPWKAYSQFIMGFLAPLTIGRYVTSSWLHLTQMAWERLSLRDISRVLPLSSWLNPHVLMHIHLHAMAIRGRKADRERRPATVSRKGLAATLRNLKSSVESLCTRATSPWQDYYEYQSAPYILEKEHAVRELMSLVEGERRVCVDLGANAGVVTELFASVYHDVVAVDSDEEALEALRVRCQKRGIGNIHTTVVDLAHPTPGLGWVGEEHHSFMRRFSSSDLVAALAIVHHLRIHAGATLEAFANLLAKLGRYALVEWVPENDPWLQRLRNNLGEPLRNYNLPAFEVAMSRYFDVVRAVDLPQGRRLFLLRRLAEGQRLGNLAITL